MDQSPSWEAYQSLQLVKRFPAFLWDPSIHEYCETEPRLHGIFNQTDLRKKLDTVLPQIVKHPV
jgi:hypothetical protein